MADALTVECSDIMTIFVALTIIVQMKMLISLYVMSHQCPQSSVTEIRLLFNEVKG